MVQKMSFSSAKNSTNTFPKSSPSSRPILFGTAKAPPTSPLSDPKHKKRPRKASEESDSDNTHNSPSLKRHKNLAGPPSPTPLSPTLPRAASPEEQEIIEVAKAQGDTKAIDKKAPRPRAANIAIAPHRRPSMRCRHRIGGLDAMAMLRCRIDAASYQACGPRRRRLS